MLNRPALLAIEHNSNYGVLSRPCLRPEWYEWVLDRPTYTISLCSEVGRRGYRQHNRMLSGRYRYRFKGAGA
jgi:hypothetical protein